MNKKIRLIFISLSVSLLVCLFYAAPLFRHGRTGIAYSFQAEPGGPVYMEPGDHLQLMYHFWLLADTLWGETRLFRNPYEFNTGTDSEDPALHGTYYAPFGPIFALLYPLLGNAAAWNLTSFLSLWIGYLGMIMLLRRYVRSFRIAVLGALPVLLMPYRWLTLLGGSPTGFTMMWPPLIMLGIDIAARDKRLRGAWLAGLALLFSKWSDTHVFFFSFLTIPFWTLISLSKGVYEAKNGNTGRIPTAKLVARRLYHLWPLALCMGLALAATTLISRSLEGSVMETGRTLRETLLFTPTHRGLLNPHVESGHDFQLYLGCVMLAVLFIGLLLLIFNRGDGRSRLRYDMILYIALLVAASAVIWLALGPRMPLDPHMLVFRTVRRFIPPYRMIRQTAKIYALMPSIISMLFGLALAGLARLRIHKAWRAILIGGIALAVVFDYGRRINPAICLLDREQKAYEAIVHDAKATGRELRAMALPLWPGDSHWSSLYEYYSSLYRIRMINGYSPVVEQNYITEIFTPFYPFNVGYIENERLDNLLSRGIGYLLLHEDAFPYKVSPFPVMHTLSAMKQHPRLQLLKRDRAVWAFRIMESIDAPSGAPEHDFYFPARLWFAAFSAPQGSRVMTDRNDVNRGRYLRIYPEGNPFALPAQPLHSIPGLRYFARISGHGSFRATIRITGNTANESINESVSSWNTPDDWEWFELPAPDFDGYRLLHLELESETGELDIDMVLLGAGYWPAPEIGDTIKLPASAFFRSGYSLPATGQVILEHQRVRATPFFGPNHSLPGGLYEIRLSFDSPARSGTELGRIRTRFPLGSDALDVPLIAGEDCRFLYTHEHNLLFGIELQFAGKADLIVNELKLTRVK